jgi:threonine dehydrogenase-like Zn-dependent dehydrogenase
VKALVWYGTRDVRFEDAPDPEPGPGEVVFDVELAGICGSDLHGYRGHPGPRVPPLVLGHEVVGRVDGELHTLYPLAGCGSCEHCLAGEDNLCDSWRLIGMHRPGVFAERVAVPRRSLVPLPTGLDRRRAVLAEPLACCVGALAPYELAGGSEVAVLGCGPLGLLSIYLAARTGARVTAVDPVPERLERARRLGADAALESGEELEPGATALVVDAAGFETTWRAGLAAVRNGGDVVVLGLGQADAPFPMAVLVRKAVRLRGQFAYSRAEFARAVEVLGEGDLDLAWLSDARLSDGAEAFANLVDQPAEYAKILLSPE